VFFILDFKFIFSFLISFLDYKLIFNIFLGLYFLFVLDF